MPDSKMKLKVISTGSIGNAYILSNGDEALLIEAGVNIKEIKQALNFDYSKVAGCIVSHSHGDHAKSIKEVMALGINVFASSHTFLSQKADGHYNAKIIGHGCFLTLGKFKVTVFNANHNVPCLGFIIEHNECGKTLFLTDSYYSKYTFENLNNIIVETNYSKKIIDYKKQNNLLENNNYIHHFSLENCKDMLSANDLSAVNNIVLIHLSDTNSNEAQFVQEVFDLTSKNVCAAYNGMEMEFNKKPF